ncbi:hypothetical protein CVT25_010415 [Psilocybe cyanescens]|uniref:Uncharacterized protein n=1 Tax=Psilocybe cyanescens TaxID=93625 RepID=A0A409X2Q1_PSICY|nr:hypothetical protein CVT25_010415 [Psilocybe cyanescens]
MDALEILPNLRQFQKNFNRFKTPRKLEVLKGLEYIIISAENISHPYHDEIFENLAKAIAQNPGLTSINISGNLDYIRHMTNKSRSLQQLFKYYPATTPPLLTVTNDLYTLEIDALRGLEEIFISTEHTSQLYQYKILENLVKAIAQNPGLTSINITSISHYGRPISNKFQTLHQLFKYYPAIVPPLRFCYLKINSCLLRLDDVRASLGTHLSSFLQTSTTLTMPLITLSALTLLL